MKIEVLEEPLYAGAIACETGAFRKWLKIKHPDVEVITPYETNKVDLHDFTLVMPLVQLITDGSVLSYLNLVLEYSNYYFSYIWGQSKLYLRTIFFLIPRPSFRLLALTYFSPKISLYHPKRDNLVS